MTVQSPGFRLDQGEICDLADKYEAQVFVDECHATGFLGRALGAERWSQEFKAWATD